MHSRTSGGPPANMASPPVGRSVAWPSSSGLAATVPASAFTSTVSSTTMSASALSRTAALLPPGRRAPLAPPSCPPSASGSRRRPDQSEHLPCEEQFYSLADVGDAASAETDGRRLVGVSLRADGAGAAFYPPSAAASASASSSAAGAMAVVQSVSSSSSESGSSGALHTFLYDRDPRRTLLGSFDSSGVGSVQESLRGGKKKRRCFDGHASRSACGCTNFVGDKHATNMCANCEHSSSLHESGRQLLVSLCPSSSSSAAAAAGELSFTLLDARGNKLPPLSPSSDLPFALPFEFRVNKELLIRINKRRELSVLFKCKGVQHSFALQWAHAAPVASNATDIPSQAKANQLHSSNSDSQLLQAGKQRDEQTVSSLLASLTQLQQRIMHNLVPSSGAARSATLARPSTAHQLSGSSVGRGNTRPLSSSSFSPSGGPHADLVDLMDPSLHVSLRPSDFRERHPALKRGRAIRGASGKYSVHQDVPPCALKQLPLPALTHSSFDASLASEKNQGKLIVVFVTAAFIPACKSFHKSVESLHGALTDAERELYALYSFDLAHSSLLLTRFNMRSAPGMLCFFHGHLVRAEVFGGPAVAHRKRDPCVLFVEKEWANQQRMEAAVKTAGLQGKAWSSVLASGVEDVMRYASGAGSAAGGPQYDALVMDVDSLEPATAMMIYTAASRRAPIVPNGSEAKVESRPALYVIALSSRPPDTLARSLSFPLSALLPVPLNAHTLATALRQAHSKVAPPVGHTGVNKIDLKNRIHASYLSGLASRFMSSSFRFGAGSSSSPGLEAARAAPGRIAAGGALSHSSAHSVQRTQPAPPPPQPPAIAIVEAPVAELSAKEKRALAAKEKAAAKLSSPKAST